MYTFEAQERLETAALRSITAHHYSNPTHAHFSDEAQYADEQLALAARDLVRAVEALPAERRPVGWDAEEAAAR
ncbi:hypothetical protein Ade02nite_19110 [Paractinoplanes deccanensis]|uniref:Uncharacterized protein n=1 Tax=Paractinoplanes deccanensis TaxID=113561 RepID=A0ABQ3XZV8_9ACTN|nr:hypothetical protein [Actinoplanes deccanensis]GID73270.1 hypothetical protein Ade02nite_19110 [Actinoplanes deccanensis]